MLLTMLGTLLSSAFGRAGGEAVAGVTPAAIRRGDWSMPGKGTSGCVFVSDDPLLRKAGMSGCLKPVRLGLMIMVPSLNEHGIMRQTSWNMSQPSSDQLQVEVLEWPTPPCTVGDSKRLAPRMRGAAPTAWMRSKGRGNSTWWCAQRGHLQGVQRLVNTVPGADFYLLIDADTQGVRRPLTLPRSMSSHALRSYAPTRLPSSYVLSQTNLRARTAPLAPQFFRAPWAHFSCCWSTASCSRTRISTQGT